MLKESSKLIVCKGPKVTRFDLKKDKPTKADLEKHLLGPTGNLRAPTLRKGKTMIVGFNEEVYRELFG
jgi:arsenate reductase-like glutaredoxin family protein